MSAKRPATNQKATSHDGASRPRNDRSSTPSCAWQQTLLTAIAGDGQKTDRASNAINAAAARRRLLSIDIEPFSDHAQGCDDVIAVERGCDLVCVGACG